MMRESRGPTLFYAWIVLTTAIVVIGTRLDGGSSSPLDGLLFLTLTFMAVAYPPYGVVAMGSVITGSYFHFVDLPDVSTSGSFYLTVLASVTIICAMASANSWAAYDPPGHADPHPGDARRDGPADRHPEPPRLPGAGHLRGRRRGLGPPDRRLPRRPRPVQGGRRPRRARRGRRRAQGRGHGPS